MVAASQIGRLNTNLNAPDGHSQSIMQHLIGKRLFDATAG